MPNTPELKEITHDTHLPLYLNVLYSNLFNYKHIHLKLVIHTFDYTITKRAFKASNFNEHLLPIKLVTN